MSIWSKELIINLSDNFSLNIPLTCIDNESGFHIYSFNLMGKAKYNTKLAELLSEKLAGTDFDVIVCAESKSIALAQELCRIRDMEKYVVIRKSRKSYMADAVFAKVKSITTQTTQTLWLDGEDSEYLKSRKILIFDDVISTGSTLDGLYSLLDAYKNQIVANACILTEDTQWTAYKGVPVISLGHLPLPGII